MERFQYLIIVILLMLSACGGRQVAKYSAKPGKGFYYTVKPGETLWQIASVHKVTAQQIAEWNNIQDPDKVAAGMRIFVPKTRAGGARSGKFDAPLAFDRDRFRWPVKGSVISGFGMRDGNRHDGVDIKASSGAPIYAAADGEVVYSGNLRGYGNLIILRHADRYYTTYAHNQKNLVAVGRHVTAGEKIALVGATGRATGPHLHFEVRLGATSRNPLFFMPAENNAEERDVRVATGKFKKFDRSKMEKKRADRKKNKKIDKMVRTKS
jgi:murein DD-endopeptidase MepM/ murein hydrolase activator NlpD